MEEVVKRKPGRPKKVLPPKKMSREEALRKLEELDRLEAEARKKLIEAQNANPFWFFEPSTGEITPDKVEFLKKYIKEEDIPQKLDSQLDIILSNAPTVGAFGGNQSGKSSVGAIKRYIQVTGEIPLSLEGIYPKERLRTDFSYCERVRIVGVDNKTLLNTVIPTYQKWVPREYLKKGSWAESYSAEQRTLFLFKGGKGEPIASFEFMTNQQEVESFQGPPIHRITYDEEPKQAIRKENLMRFVTTGRVDEMFCMTPTNGITWATDLFDGEEIEDGVECYKLVSLTNKMASVIALEKIIDGLDSYDERKMRLLGETISLSGLIYGKFFDKRLHVIEPFFDDLTQYQKDDYLLITGLDPHTNTDTPMVFLLLDREGNAYVDRCWMGSADTAVVRSEWHRIIKECGYRTGWSVADRSCDSDNKAFGGRNIYLELTQGPTAIRGMRKSEKHTGSINVGVDIIKRRLKLNESSGKPTLFVVNRPENALLINSFRTLERDTYADEERNGPKDRIKEGKHHMHAALRYIFQFPLNWYPKVDNVPQPEYFDEVCSW